MSFERTTSQEDFGLLGAVWDMGCFRKLGVHFVGVVVIRALIFWCCIGARDIWKLSYRANTEERQIPYRIKQGALIVVCEDGGPEYFSFFWMGKPVGGLLV